MSPVTDPLKADSLTEGTQSLAISASSGTNNSTSSGFVLALPSETNELVGGWVNPEASHTVEQAPSSLSTNPSPVIDLTRTLEPDDAGGKPPFFLPTPPPSSRQTSTLSHASLPVPRDTGDVFVPGWDSELSELTSSEAQSDTDDDAHGVDQVRVSSAITLIPPAPTHLYPSV